MALAIDSQMPTATAAFATNSISLTYSFNNVGGGLVVVGVAVGGSTVASATYAGVSLGAADKTTSWNTNGAGCGIFHKLGAATGTQPVVANATLLCNAIVSGCVSFTGHDTTTPIVQSNSAISNVSTTTVSVTLPGTVAGNIVVDCAGCGGGTGGGFTGFTNLSWLANVDTASAGDNGASSTAIGGGSITMSYSISSDVWGIVAVEVAALAVTNATFATSITGTGRFSGTTLTFPGVLDFGDPGGNEAQLVITGQTGIVSGSQVEAWIQEEAYGGLRTALDMAYASQSIGLTCGSIVPGVGFTIYGRCLQKMQGRFKVRWFWV